MKRLILILFLVLGLYVNLRADGEGDNGGNTSGQVIKKKTKPSFPERAKAPSRVMILFSYDYEAETVYFELPAEVEYIDITMRSSETFQTYFGTASATSPEWFQPLSTGEYTITCITDNGDVYEGYVFI